MTRREERLLDALASLLSAAAVVEVVAAAQLATAWARGV